MKQNNMQLQLEKNPGYFQEGTFPVKLHQMLEAVSETELSQYVSWDPDGLSFSITDPKEFSHQIMGNFFNQTRYKSFQRQLNFYGFHRACRGKIRGVYTHPMFRRDKPDLCNQMKRLDSRDFKKESQSSASKRIRKVSVGSLHPLPPHEIFITSSNIDFEPLDVDFPEQQQEQQQPVQVQEEDPNTKSLYSLLFPQSVSPTSCRKGSIRTHAVTLESDCDSSMGTIDILPSTYLSWETNEGFGDDLFQSI